MKEHIQREMIDELTRAAKVYGYTQQMRDIVSKIVAEHLVRDTLWTISHGPMI